MVSSLLSQYGIHSFEQIISARKEIIGPLHVSIDGGAGWCDTANIIAASSDKDGLIYAFEPFPGNHRFFDKCDPRIKLIKKAIGDSHGTENFIVSQVVQDGDAWADKGLVGYSSAGYLANNISLWKKLKRKLRSIPKSSNQKNSTKITKVDFDLLQNRCFTFGLNKINLLFERTKFRPDCVLAVNPYVIEQNMSFFNDTNIPLYLDKEAFLKRWVKPDKNITFLDSTYLPGFAKDCSISINQGNTVTYIAMQLAFHMGFKDVALVGADHNFASSGPANKTVQGGDKDESHFDPSYFAGVKWQLPDLFESEVAYTRAKNMFEAHDRKIYNCTDGGKLEVFDRITLENFIGMK